MPDDQSIYLAIILLGIAVVALWAVAWFNSARIDAAEFQIKMLKAHRPKTKKRFKK